MQRYAALWVFPVVSLVLVVFMTIRGGQVVDAPDESPASGATEVAALAERNANLSVILGKSVDARSELQRHVRALHDELSEMRAARTAIVAEAKLWRDSYDVLASRFDELAKLARSEYGALGDGGVAPVPASFERVSSTSPRPSDVIIVR
jgi:cell division protein FtsB